VTVVRRLRELACAVCACSSPTGVPASPPPLTTRAPVLDPACVAPPETAPRCDRDDGFPAISADGKTIANKIVPPDPGRGAPGVSIELIDVATAQRADLAVLAPDDFDLDHAAQLAPEIARRTAAIQKRLHEGGYRALDSLHAELDGEAIRIVDPATNRVVMRDRLAPTTRLPDGCGAWSLMDANAWWDRSTGAVFVTQRYAPGREDCFVQTAHFVRRVTVAR